MSTRCPKCGHERGPDEVVPDYECPRCGVVYQKYIELQQRIEAWAKEDQADLTAAAPGAALAAAPGCVAGGAVPEPRAVPGGEGDPAAGPSRVEESPVRPGARRFPWAVAGALFALLLAISVVAVSRRPPAAEPSPAEVAAGYDLGGTWVGRAILPIDGRSHGTYEADYRVRVTINEEPRVVGAEWTETHFLLEQSTIRWSDPEALEYTLLRREAFSDPYRRPERGDHTLIRLEGGLLTIESRHERCLDLPHLYASLELGEEDRGSWPRGEFHPRMDGDGIEATFGGGYPSLGLVEFTPDQLTCTLPQDLVSRVLRTYQKNAGAQAAARNWSDPIDGLELVDVAVPYLPGRVYLSVRPLRGVLLEGPITLDANGEPSAWVELVPESRYTLDFRDPVWWEARLAAYPDGRVVARLRYRDLEVPLERESGAALLTRTADSTP